jgi:hypothetical protein
LLRRSVARAVVWTATAAATTTTTAPAPTTTASAITTTVAASVTTTIGAAGVLSATAATVIATAETLTTAIAAATGWIVLRGIVVRRKILRSRSVGLRLFFVRGITAFAVKTIELFSGERVEGRSYVAGLGFGVFLAREHAFTAGKMRDRVPGIRERQILKVFGFVWGESNFFAFGVSAVQSFAGQQFNGGSCATDDRRRGGRSIVCVAVIVILEIFENVADVKKRVAVQTNFDEGRLHSRKDAGDFTFVDAADQREFFFALDVNLD